MCILVTHMIGIRANTHEKLKINAKFFGSDYKYDFID